MRSAGRALVLGALLACAVALPASAEERILALAPHVVEILYAVGAGPEIVGAVSFADHPPAAKALPRIGDYRKVSVEAALRLEPTIAIAMDEEVIGLDRLRELGVRVETSHPTTVEGVLDNIVRLGTIAGHRARAEEVAAELRARLEVLRESRFEQAPTAFYEIWHEPLIAAGGGSFISDALREIGVANVFGDLPSDSPRVSIEAVLRKRPDVLILPGESRDVGERVAEWTSLFRHPGLRTVEAAHDLLHRPGPRLIDGMEKLQRDLRLVLGPATSP